MKLAVVLVSYNHHLNAEKGKLENKESWEEVRQILQEKDKTPSKEVSVMDVTMVTPPKEYLQRRMFGDPMEKIHQNYLRQKRKELIMKLKKKQVD